jgi:hypothetical protein
MTATVFHAQALRQEGLAHERGPYMTEKSHPHEYRLTISEIQFAWMRAHFNGLFGYRSLWVSNTRPVSTTGSMMREGWVAS